MSRLRAALALSVALAPMSLKAQDLPSLRELAAMASRLPGGAFDGRSGALSRPAVAYRRRSEPVAALAVSLVDGARRPLAAKGIFIRVMDSGGRQLFSGFVSSPQVLIKDIPVRDDSRDNVSVVASAKGYGDAGIFPVRLSPGAAVPVDLMLLKKSNRLGFAGAGWDALRRSLPALWALAGRGAPEDARTRYEGLLQRKPEAAACLLNIGAAASQIELPDGSPLSYLQEIIWDSSMAKDRFYAWADARLLEHVRAGAAAGAFTRVSGPGVFHPGATESYKQNEFGGGNVQFTFYGTDARLVKGVRTLKVELDMDLHKDGLSHFLFEVLPHWGRRGFTDPRKIYQVRWMAARRQGAPEFDPLYTVE